MSKSISPNSKNGFKAPSYSNLEYTNWIPTTFSFRKGGALGTVRAKRVGTSFENGTRTTLLGPWTSKLAFQTKPLNSFESRTPSLKHNLRLSLVLNVISIPLHL